MRYNLAKKKTTKACQWLFYWFTIVKPTVYRTQQRKWMEISHLEALLMKLMSSGQEVRPKRMLEMTKKKKNVNKTK